jgi:guanylate cyclase
MSRALAMLRLALRLERAGFAACAPLVAVVALGTAASFASVMGATPEERLAAARQLERLAPYVGVLLPFPRRVETLSGFVQWRVFGGLPFFFAAWALLAGVAAIRGDAAEAERCAADSDVPFEIRIGIDTGPVVAGVIGRSKFIYDLWGDTVNTASRMESHAPPGAIQVTERVQQLLRPTFELDARGPIDVKGKGTVSTYLLMGRRGQDGPPARSRLEPGAAEPEAIRHRH